MLRFSMRHRWIIVLACFASLFSMKWTLPLVPKNFLPEDDESQFQVTVRAQEGTTLQATSGIAGRIADDIRKLDGVAYTVVTIGNNAQQTPNLATIFVKLIPAEKRPTRSQQFITQETRVKVLPQYGNLRTAASLVPAFSTGQTQADITYVVSGPNLEKLTEYSWSSESRRGLEMTAEQEAISAILSGMHTA
jgi:HAE1 family hydrophobic/amphiphilic exporter-1